MSLEIIDLKKFSGQLPLFPLPNVVHFPNTLLPLHIFETRYQKLLQDAMEGEKLIGMAVLKPGWEEQYQGNPDIYDVACLGQVVKYEPLQGGRSNILLLGLKRVKIQDIIRPYPYRLAKVELIEESRDDLSPEQSEAISNDLLSIYSQLVIEMADSGKKFPTLSDSELDLSQLCDALAASIGFEIQEMVEILGEANLLNRVGRIKEKMNLLMNPKLYSSLIKVQDGSNLRVHLN